MASSRRGSFDAIRDIAEVFPLSVFPDALGINSEGRENFLTYGAMVLAGMGPENDYFRSLMAHAPTVLPWVTTAKCQREALAPGSFGAQVYEAADTGEISEEEAPLLVALVPVGRARHHDQRHRHGALHLARHRDQWAILAADAVTVPRRLRREPALRLGSALRVPHHPARNRNRRRSDRRA